MGEMGWYIFAEGQQYGPVDDDTLEIWIGEGRLQKEHFVWSQEANNWVPLREFPRFAKVFEMTTARGAGLLGAPSSAAPSSFMTPNVGTRLHFAESPDPEGHRHYIRLALHIPLRWAESLSSFSPTKNFTNAFATNISFGGLAFEAMKPPAVGRTLHLELGIGDAEGPFHCLGEVRRHAPGFEPGATEVGCSFQNLSEDLRRQLFGRLEAAHKIRPPE